MNKLREMLAACGKRPIDLGRELGELHGKVLRNPSTAASRFLGENPAAPTLRVAEEICSVLSKWAGREVPVSKIFPDGICNGGPGGQLLSRDDSAIAAILAD